MYDFFGANDEDDQPHVLIVGGGIAGLLLGILFEYNGTSYEIFEKTREVKPLGSLLSLNANVLPALEQIGLYEELLAISFPTPAMHIYTETLKKITTFHIKNEKELYGYDCLVFHRPALYDLLLSRIPEEKIHFGKKVLSIQNMETGVTIRCTDKITYYGDILIGADGAYSGVRQSLYRQLSDEGLLPEVDKKSLNRGYICLLGTTEPMDSNTFPELKQMYSESALIISNENPSTWATFSIPGDRLCWVVIIQLGAKETEEIIFRGTEWTPEENEPMLQQFYDCKIPNGTGESRHVLGHLFDATPKDLISRVVLEDKLFETWNHGRVALLGDACHKLLPSSGQGAVNAMEDAIIMANCLYDLKSGSTEHVKEAFEDYKSQRYPHAKMQYESSKIAAKVQYGHTFTDRILRQIVLNYLPMKYKTKDAYKNMSYRPQVCFLPQTPKRGTCAVLPQKPSRRVTEENKEFALAV